MGEFRGKPLLLAAVIVLAAFFVWSFNLLETPLLVIAVIVLLVAAFLFDPSLIDDSADASFGSHSRASDQQILEIPEEHEEEAHHTEAGH